jgi:hypothetical protein
LLGFAQGLDVIAGVVAHEIGHNLGLDHLGDDLPNLMSPGGTTEQLDASQINSVLALSPYVVSIPEPGTVVLFALGGLVVVATHMRRRSSTI